MDDHARVAMKALAVVWHVRCESARGGLTPSSVRRYRKTIEGWQGPKRKTAWYAWRHFSSSSRAQVDGSGQDGHWNTSHKLGSMFKSTSRNGPFPPSRHKRDEKKQIAKATYAFVFFGDLGKTQLEYSFKKPSAPVYVAIVSSGRYHRCAYIGRKGE